MQHPLRSLRPAAALAAAATIALALAGCDLLGIGKKKASGPADLGAPAAVTAAPAPDGAGDRIPIDRVAAVVNSVVITWLELDEKARPAAMARVAGESDPAKKTELFVATYREVLDAMIINELLEQEAAKLALTVTTDEIDRAVDGIMKRNGMDKPTFLAELKKAGYTEASHRTEVRGHLLRMKVVALKVKSRISTDDDVLKAYYEKFKREFSEPPQVHLQVIILGLPPSKTDPDYAKLKAAKLAEAEGIKKEVEGGKSFAEIANERYPGGFPDGDFGWQKVDAFGDAGMRGAAATMKTGEVRIVADDRNVRVVRLVERREGSFASFESVKGEILEKYAEEETERLSSLWYSELKTSAYVEIKIPELAVGAAAPATSGTAVP